MMLSVILALFLPCVVMSAVFIIYLFILWYFARREINLLTINSTKHQLKKGLSLSDLQKLPTLTGKDLILGSDCAVCLDEISDEDVVTMLPGCNHGFHKECAEMWLIRNGECPLCRTKIETAATAALAEVLCSSENSPV